MTSHADKADIATEAGKERFDDLLRQRYGILDTQPSAWLGQYDNDVIRTMLNHRSVRSYAAKALPDDILQIVAAAAQSASTSSNLQAWSVVAVRDAGRKERLAAHAGNQKHVANAPLVLVFIADLSRLRRVSDSQSMPGLGLDYQETFLVAVADAAFAAQNAVTALESLGLGCCYIGGMRNQPEKVAEELKLPAGAFAVFGLTVGYPNPEVVTDVKPRLPASVVMHEEQYASESEASLNDYEAAVNAFQKRQQMQDLKWSAQAARRVRGPEALSGRDRLVEALHALGFALK